MGVERADEKLYAVVSVGGGIDLLDHSVERLSMSIGLPYTSDTATLPGRSSTMFFDTCRCNFLQSFKEESRTVERSPFHH